MYNFFLKRLLDFLATLIGIVILSPFFVLVFVGLFIVNKGNVFFVQPRPGKNGKVFKIYKFKTMTDERDANGILLPDADRLTIIGNLVRKTSLDEIPQLFNVLKGDMSLIGPRPLLTQYLHLYNDFQNRRHEVKPGITGWAQVNGRNAISWDQKFQYDVWYVDNISFLVDIKILFLTFLKVIKKEGINAVDSATIEPFNGQ
ncbi:sugar transferase [Flavobacterium columnare]|uniref:sugar transferase n=1 Tax=Flavobacterium columnare TaxID=996 RepID=UPI0009817466|nr:sugar transferase [Flavobacterium columnare]MBF6652514.1 lipid carrier--UDP-N-acetylgalactosaminyltransferase [Flavobacterium columnare]MBF6655528.1 lipid carrier--UDP-N-acetylgalactosaminyltransferase [Flavobacterium columnare]MBF6658383.1 lipid carrier--UDP-N-acetylgalactosaminyltransferase [Flavobacterium columnare]OOB81758.1 lipid carrier--UDP-N-acetylgalactosaminyltransferase [Flavobacterium columnare]PTD14823.1 sugar transferase [Flavobacterium columnare]